MVRQRLGRSELWVTPIGFGAFKIGRNTGIKYPHGYDLPDDEAVETLLNGVLDLGINYIDTAPAYGCSEERIGRFLSHRRSEFVVSTKVGETYEQGVSHYDFSKAAVCDSVTTSLRRLNTEVLDLVLIHSNGQDQQILNQTGVVETLLALRDQGIVRAVGFSGKTVEGAMAVLGWADVIMVEYHIDDTSHAAAIETAAKNDVGVVVKKGLASGRLPADEAVRFVLNNNAAISLVIGGLNIDHLRANVEVASQVRPDVG